MAISPADNRQQQSERCRSGRLLTLLPINGMHCYENETRVLWDGYVNRQAELNGVKPMHVGAQFSVAPSVQQTMENKIQASDELLKKHHAGVGNGGRKIGAGDQRPGVVVQFIQHGTPRAAQRSHAGQRQIPLRNLIMIGFNGVSHAAKSDLENPLLQDVNIGWLQQYRANAPARVLKTSR